MPTFARCASLLLALTMPCLLGTSPTWTWGQHTVTHPYLVIIGLPHYDLHLADATGTPSISHKGLKQLPDLCETAADLVHYFQDCYGIEDEAWRCCHFNTCTTTTYVSLSQRPMPAQDTLHKFVHDHLFLRLQRKAIDGDGFILFFLGYSYQSRLIYPNGSTYQETMGEVAKKLVIGSEGKPVLLVDMTVPVDQGEELAHFYAHDTIADEHLGIALATEAPYYISLVQVSYHAKVGLHFWEHLQAYRVPMPWQWQWWWQQVGGDLLAQPLQLEGLMYSAAYDAYWGARIPLWRYRWPIGIAMASIAAMTYVRCYGLPSFAMPAASTSSGEEAIPSARLPYLRPDGLPDNPCLLDFLEPPSGGWPIPPPNRLPYLGLDGLPDNPCLLDFLEPPSGVWSIPSDASQ